MSAAAISPMPVEVEETHAPVRNRLRLWLIAASLLILTLGAVEDRFGNTDSGDIYGSDAVQYLDIARAIEHHDWESALNPLWSQGYPAVLAVGRPLFPAGPAGDYYETRVLNFGIFVANYLAFLYLLFALREVLGLRDAERNHRMASVFFWTSSLILFFTTQVCLGQVSRVNPDEVVTTCFFLATAFVLRLTHRPTVKRGVVLGLLLGVAFLFKAIFLALGCGILGVLAISLWQRHRRITPALVAGVIFATIVLSYGAALSKAVGHRTFGEAGSINYAWHVNRLQKWVHWEGGNQTAAEAWPSARLARFAQWDTRPPDFGLPVHPSVIAQESPRVYTFAAPIHATYVPYFNPPYWYTGYHHIVRVRYQLIALAKSFVDLMQAMVRQPIFFSTLFVLGLLLWRRSNWIGFGQRIRKNWAALACALVGTLLYFPVHLEGRYLAGFLASLGLCSLIAAASVATAQQLRVASVVMALGLLGDLALYQRPVWVNMLHHKSPQQNVEWEMGQAVLAEHLPADSQVGVIAWTANLHSDWAYLAHLQITSEIASNADFNMFWKSCEEEQLKTLETFRKAGAAAVFVNSKPAGLGSAGWRHLSDSPMWIYRFDEKVSPPSPCQPSISR